MVIEKEKEMAGDAPKIDFVHKHNGDVMVSGYSTVVIVDGEGIGFVNWARETNMSTDETKYFLIDIEGGIAEKVGMSEQEILEQAVSNWADN